MSGDESQCSPEYHDWERDARGPKIHESVPRDKTHLDLVLHLVVVLFFFLVVLVCLAVKI